IVGLTLFASSDPIGVVKPGPVRSNAGSDTIAVPTGIEATLNSSVTPKGSSASTTFTSTCSLALAAGVQWYGSSEYATESPAFAVHGTDTVSVCVLSVRFRSSGPSAAFPPSDRPRLTTAPSGVTSNFTPIASSGTKNPSGDGIAPGSAMPGESAEHS